MTTIRGLSLWRSRLSVWWRHGATGGAVLGVVGVGVGDAILDAAGHVAVGVIFVRVRRSRFGVDTCDRMRDARAVLIRPPEPAGLIGGG
jgi:hypothetical protein